MTTAAQRAAYTYSYVEPHPTLPATNLVSTGRGGAGNSTRLCPKNTTDGATATGPASRSPIIAPKDTGRRVTVGRGGAGNVKPPTKPGSLVRQTVDELDREERLDQAELRSAPGRVQHYGRGGQGNVVKSRQGSDAGSVASSRRDSVISSISAGSDRGGERSSRSGSFVEKMANKLRRGSDEKTSSSN